MLFLTDINLLPGLVAVTFYHWMIDAHMKES